MYAEIAIVRLLRKDGFDGVWVDTYGHGNQAKFWKSMSEESALPEHAREVYEKIVRANDARIGGCWDVLAWKPDEFLFVESKGPGDKIKLNQAQWLEAAKKAKIPGVTESCFVVCEWREIVG